MRTWQVVELRRPVRARALIATAQQAPYGRGPETVLDRSVRDCWQIDADEVTVGGGVWGDTLAEIVDRAAEGLGCPRECTKAHWPAGGRYHIPRDQFEQLAQLRQSGTIDGLSDRGVEHLRRRVESLQQRTGRPLDELVAAGEATYE